MEAKMLESFNKALSSTKIKHGELIALRENGWREECPTEGCWHFTHPDFPNAEVCWNPGWEPKVITW